MLFDFKPLQSQECLAILLFGILSVASTAGCGSKVSSKPKAATPAKVEMVPRESELATITLTSEACESLGITTSSVERRKIQRHRTFGGEIVTPPGKAISVVAPVNGTVTLRAEHSLPTPGAHIRAGDYLFSLQPILSPERDVPTPAERVQIAGARATLVAAQVIAGGDLERARTDVHATEITLDRAKKLFADRAGSRRAVDDAQALFDAANVMLQAAQDRYSKLSELLTAMDEPREAEGTATELPVLAHVDGVLRSLAISPGQQVIAGAPLIELLDLSIVWVRVPVFIDLISSIDPMANGRVVSLDGKAAIESGSGKLAQALVATPVNAPPTSDASNASTDLYFEVTNSFEPQKRGFSPGQRVGMQLPMQHELEAVIVPAKSILYDIHGGTWVYAQTKPNTFERKRVVVQWFDGGEAILARGPDEGVSIVVDGAAELFGTEFGPGK